MPRKPKQTPRVASPLISFRSADPKVQERVAKLAEVLRKHPSYTGVRVNDSTVHNMAHLRGLEALEAEFGTAPKSKPKKPKK